MNDPQEKRVLAGRGPCARGGGGARRRSGFSLLEVVLALAIFFMSAVALSQLLRAGSAAAAWGDRLTEATLRCESKLAEIVASAERPESEPATPLPDDEDEGWETEVDVVPTGFGGLVRVTATVRHVAGDKADAEVSLARLLAHPSGLEPPKAAATLAPAPSSTLTMEQMLGIEGASQ